MINKPQVTIITGGSSGIGQAVALSLAKKNSENEIIIIAKDLERIKETENKIHTISECEVFSYPGDLSQDDFINQSFSDIRKRYKYVTFLVNSAGSPKLSGGLFETSATEWDESLSLNLRSAFTCSKLAAKLMIDSGTKGAIVNIGSIAGYIGTERISYAAAKAGLSGLTRSLARTLAAFAIRVNAVAPGAIDTPATEHWTDKQKENICKNIPLGRIGTPTEIANVVEFLLSESSSYITGQTLHVNGGWYLG